MKRFRNVSIAWRCGEACWDKLESLCLNLVRLLFWDALKFTSFHCQSFCLWIFWSIPNRIFFLQVHIWSQFLKSIPEIRVTNQKCKIKSSTPLLLDFLNNYFSTSDFTKLNYDAVNSTFQHHKKITETLPAHKFAAKKIIWTYISIPSNIIELM